MIAVLDWELSTIGNPISDLAYFIMPYFWPREVHFFGHVGEKSFTDIEGKNCRSPFKMLVACLPVVPIL